ncbi:MAG: sigma-70 family RNA polymerase sigma factor [Polyangiaceae bacterium]
MSDAAIDPSDEALLAAARTGDKAALETLLERHQAQVYRFGMKLCRDPEDAEDVLQDTMLAMARGIRDFRGASSLSTWLYTVARRFCIKKRQHAPLAGSGAPMPEAEQIADPSPKPDDAYAGKEVERAFEQGIRKLEPMYREVLLLRDVEGLSAAEVAEVLEISVDAVKSRLHRARVSVRDHVAPALGIPSDLPKAEGTCPDVSTLFSRHLEDEIDADMCREMERHIASCPRCKSACDSLKSTLALCRTSGPVTKVPENVQNAVKRALRDFLAETP